MFYLRQPSGPHYCGIKDPTHIGLVDTILNHPFSDLPALMEQNNLHGSSMETAKAVLPEDMPESVRTRSVPDLEPVRSLSSNQLSLRQLIPTLDETMADVRANAAEQVQSSSGFAVFSSPGINPQSGAGLKSIITFRCVGRCRMLIWKCRNPQLFRQSSPFATSTLVP